VNLFIDAFSSFFLKGGFFLSWNRNSRVFLYGGNYLLVFPFKAWAMIGGGGRGGI
jgi:hypothetical protein